MGRLVLRRVVLLGTPLALALLEVFHPQPSGVADALEQGVVHGVPNHPGAPNLVSYLATSILWTDQATDMLWNEMLGSRRF